MVAVRGRHHCLRQRVCVCVCTGKTQVQSSRGHLGFRLASFWSHATKSLTVHWLCGGHVSRAGPEARKASIPVAQHTPAAVLAARRAPRLRFRVMVGSFRVPLSAGLCTRRATNLFVSERSPPKSRNGIHIINGYSFLFRPKCPRHCPNLRQGCCQL